MYVYKLQFTLFILVSMTLVRKNFNLDGINFNCWGLVKNNIVYCRLKELSDLLGYTDPSKAYKLIKEKWKITWSQLIEDVDKSSFPPACKIWHPNTLFVSEFGIYSLIFRSHKPEAKRFADHVFEVVLPTIRKDGVYVSPNITVSQANNVIQTLREQLLENERTLTEIQGALVETRGMLEEKERTLTETRGTLAETVAERNRMLTETRVEKERILVETREVLAEKNRILAEEIHQRRRLQNNMQTVRPKVAVIPDSESLRHNLSVFRNGNQYKCIRRQKRSHYQAFNRIPDGFRLVYTFENVPNAINIINRLKELLPHARFRHNTITTNADVVGLIRECIENEIDRPMTMQSEN